MLPSSKQQLQKYTRTMRDIVYSLRTLFAVPQVTESVRQNFFMNFCLSSLFFQWVGPLAKYV